MSNSVFNETAPCNAHISFNLHDHLFELHRQDIHYSRIRLLIVDWDTPSSFAAAD